MSIFRAPRWHVLLAIAVLAGPFHLQAQEFVVARVGSVPITQFELHRELERILPLKGGFHQKSRAEKADQLKEEALENLIDQAYLVLYAILEEISVPDDEVEAAYQTIRDRFDSDETLQQAAGGESPSSIRAALFRGLLARKAEVAMQEANRASEAELRDYYERNREKFKRPRLFRASSIYVKVDPALAAEEREALKQKAEDLAVRAKGGEDFYNLAYYNSDHKSRYVGGDIGSFHQGQLKDKDLEAVLVKMSPGEIVGPISNIYGYHILKLTEMEEEKQLTFEDAKPGIQRTLESERVESFRLQLMTDLKKKYPPVVQAGLAAG